MRAMRNICVIAISQTMLGGSYPLFTENSDSYKAPLYAEKARMTTCSYAARATPPLSRWALIPARR